MKLTDALLADLGRPDEAIVLARGALAKDPARVAVRKLLEAFDAGALP